MQTQSTRAQYQRLFPVGQPAAIQGPINLRHRAVGGGGYQIGNVVRNTVKMLVGLDKVMGGEGGGEMRGHIGMRHAQAPADASRMITGHAIVASVAHRVIDRRDAVANFYRNAGPVLAHALTEGVDYSAHLMARHHSAPPQNLTLPHVDFGAADVGLGNFGHHSAGEGIGNIVLEELKFMVFGNECDCTFHSACSFASSTSCKARRSLLSPGRYRRKEAASSPVQRV